MPSPWTSRDFNKAYPPDILREQGACVRQDPELFFPQDKANYSQALLICATCPVRTQCAEWAIEHHEYGCWGGTSGQDRKILRTCRNRPKMFGPIKEHGNGKASFMAHLFRGELPCDECLEARAKSKSGEMIDE